MPRSQKRNIALAADLYDMEYLSSFEFISLPALMMEHIYKVVLGKNSKHGMPYGYWLNKMFDHFGIVCENGTPGTVLQMLGMKTLVKTECVKKKSSTNCQREFSKEIEELQFNIAAKDTEVSKLNITIQHLTVKGPSVTDEL